LVGADNGRRGKDQGGVAGGGGDESHQPAVVAIGELARDAPIAGAVGDGDAAVERRAGVGRGVQRDPGAAHRSAGVRAHFASQVEPDALRRDDDLAARRAGEDDDEERAFLARCHAAAM
jgi:hypothetical protein